MLTRPDLRDRLAARHPGLPIAGAEAPALHDPDTLARALERILAATPGLDRRGQASFVLLRAVFWQACALFALHLRDEVVPDRPTRLVTLQTGDPGFDMAGGARHAAHSDRLVAMRADITAAATPLVRALRAAAGLSDAAAWRLISDAVASAALFAGRAQQAEADAARDAMVILADAPLHHTKMPTEFAPAPEGLRLRRAGCCRYHLADGGRRCDGCVLDRRATTTEWTGEAG
jgi:hypothetical protein